MAVPAKNKHRKPPSGSRTAALVILILIVGVVAGYYLLSPPEKTAITSSRTEHPHIKPDNSGSPIPLGAIPEPPAVPASPYKDQSNIPSTATRPETEKSGVVVNLSGRLAIIIDDMGGSLSEARSLAAIKVPLTFAIIPCLRVDKEVAAYAASKNIETMIHIPMQSKGWPDRRLETNGLLVSMEAGELQDRVSGFVRQFPGAVGVNNHMGSEFTEQEEKMATVLQILKKNNLFFIDSVTSPESAGLKMARRLGVRSARRNVFLDNEQKRSYILCQLNQAVRLARKNGSAIAICHPHPETIAALAAALPELAGKGISLVTASQLVN